MAEQPRRDQADKIKDEFKDKAGRETTDPKDEDARRDNPVKETIRDEARDKGQVALAAREPRPTPRVGL